MLGAPLVSRIRSLSIGFIRETRQPEPPKFAAQRPLKPMSKIPLPWDHLAHGSR